MMIQSSRARLFVYFLLIALTTLLVLEAAVSLRWRINHDTPVLYYVAMLVDKYGYIPYRDIFETSFPGTILFHVLLVKTIGYGDLAFRIVDLLWLATLSVLTVWLLQPLSRWAATAAAVLFGLVYLGSGSVMSMQREYIALLPIALALYVATRHERHASWWELTIIGGCFGFAATIKPQLALGIFPVLLYVAAGEDTGARSMAAMLKQILLRGLQVAPGFVLVAVIPFAWVWQRGGLPAFLDMVSHYLPLYLQVNGDHYVLQGWPRVFAALHDWIVGYPLCWLAASVGLWMAWRVVVRQRPRALLQLLALELVVYGLCPLLAGQFWAYHWLPFLWCSCMCVALVLIPVCEGISTTTMMRFALPLLLLFIVGTVHPLARDLLVTMRGEPMPVIKQGRVDTTVRFLHDKVQPGDIVQSLDSTSGSIHALLLVQAKLATPFICDCYFYDHVSDPYIQQLQTRFVDGIHNSRPRFIVDALPKLRPRGNDTTTRFPALEQLLREDYRVAYQDSTVLIYERKP